MGRSAGMVVLVAVVLILLTTTSLLVGRDWRRSIVILALQYVGVFILVNLYWPLEMAVVKLVAGWMSGAVLGVSMLGAPGEWREEEAAWPSGRLFRILGAVLIGLAVLSVAPRLHEWIPGVETTPALGAGLLIGLGLLQLGLTAQPLRVILGLLTVVSGFEILYAAAEASALVAGLLASLNIGLALAGAYLFTSPSLEGGT